MDVFLLPSYICATLLGDYNPCTATSVEIPRVRSKVQQAMEELNEYENLPNMCKIALAGKREQVQYWQNRLRELTDPAFALAVQNDLEQARKRRLAKEFCIRVPSPSDRLMIILCAPRVLHASALKIPISKLPRELLKALQKMLYAPRIRLTLQSYLNEEGKVGSHKINIYI